MNVLLHRLNRLKQVLARIPKNNRSGFDASFAMLNESKLIITFITELYENGGVTFDEVRVLTNSLYISTRSGLNLWRLNDKYRFDVKQREKYK